MSENSEKEKHIIEITPTEMDLFNSYVREQFEYGGIKYAGDESKPQREATDDLVDDFTYLWLIGTFAKYAKRIKNVAREKDTLKIACYMFITWLKRGYHLTPQGTDEIIDTNVAIKTQYYSMFTNVVNHYGAEISVDGKIEELYEKFLEIVNRHLDSAISLGSVNSSSVRDLIQKGFNKITEEDLIYVYKVCYLIWKNKFESNAGTDTDTYNETKK